MEGKNIQKLKIAIIAPPWFPVPPPGYGGIEMIVSLLTEGLWQRGHDVTLFASGNSITQARLISTFAEAPHKRMKENIHLENIHSLAAYEHAAEFDIIHDHNGFNSRLLGALVRKLINKPVIATLHGPADKHSVDFLSSVASGLMFVAISESQRVSYEGFDFLATIPNAIRTSDYPFSNTGGDYLLFVGRMNKEKGAHIAASTAKRLGRKLIMVGKCSEDHEKKYFNEQVRPSMGKGAEYYGEVDQLTKLELYKNAECVLFPIQWPEPFGLVMIESMACGTPVIALRNGSAPEVIRHGVTGYIVDSEDEMIEAVGKIDRINRAACRKIVAQEYDEEIFINRYEQAYMDALAISEVSAHELRVGES